MPSPNHEIKGNLAKLLATENLIVEHRNRPTASFDVDSRVLTLPLWDKASGVVYDMLVGHEVGHALFTPNEDWRDVADCPKDYVNVIEDARIEKLMKRKYPGLRKSFNGGYKELNDQDFFQVHDEDINKFSLIDRINLHFKLGADCMITFGASEAPFLIRIEEAETFEEVLQIAEEIYTLGQQDSAVNPIASVSDDDAEEVNAGDGGDTKDTDEEDTDQESDGGDINPEADLDILDYQEPSTGSLGAESFEETSRTQKAFDSKSGDLTSSHIRNPAYLEIPDEIDLNKHLVDWKVLHDWIDSHKSSTESPNHFAANFASIEEDYREYRKNSNKEVNYLVKEFECRKSADSYSRSGESKTGVLDCTKLHTYKYSEDLFKKVTVVPDGKNHGLIFLLDWSGSMSNELLSTVKQLLNLTSFCKKVQIPFEVYAFTNEWHLAQRAMGEYESVGGDYYERSWPGMEKNVVYINPTNLHLMNFISSRSSSKDYERMCINLWREATLCGYSFSTSPTIGVGLSGTPLNESILLLNYILPKFKKDNGLQKVNVCILTDGEGCQSAYGREVYNEVKDINYLSPRRVEHDHVLRDKKTGRVYPKFAYSSNGPTNTFIQQVRDRNPGVNVIGFRILCAAQLGNFVDRYADAAYNTFEEIKKKWRKEKCVILPNPKAYTAVYALSNKDLESECELSVAEGAKKGEITRAFKKMLKSKSTNKKILTSFVDQIA